MSNIWHSNGNQIDAMALPGGTFLSADITRRHIEIVRNNSAYREALEKAGRMAGYVPPVLSMARGRVSDEDASALIRQNEKGQKLIEGKRDESNTRVVLPV